MLPRRYSESAPLQESDFCYDLGSINESRHWAYEALSTDGETPWILKRAASVNFVSGDTKVAERCLNELDKTLFFKGWARKFRAYLRHPASASEDETLSHGLSMLARKDFIIVNGHPPAELDTLLSDNPKNKMAFEYRIAHELLTGRLKSLPKHLEMMSRFNYPNFPRHVEEALIGVWATSGKRDMPPFFRYIRRRTLQRFRDYNRVLARYNGNRAAARQELEEGFGDTYWFYAMYNNPIKRAMEQASFRAGGLE